MHSNNDSIWQNNKELSIDKKITIENFRWENTFVCINEDMTYNRCTQKLLIYRIERNGAESGGVNLLVFIQFHTSQGKPA